MKVDIIHKLNPKNWKKFRQIKLAGYFGDRGDLPFQIPKNLDWWGDWQNYANFPSEKGEVYLKATEGAYFFLVTEKRKEDEIPQLFSELENCLYNRPYNRPSGDIHSLRQQAHQALQEKNQVLYLEILAGKKTIEDLPKSTVKVAGKINHYPVTVTAYQCFDWDRDCIVTEYCHAIKGTHATYWHRNVFDGGDVIGKVGSKASWAVPEEYTREELEEIKKISSLIFQGIRM